MVELETEEESVPPEKDCRAFGEFGTIDTVVGRDEFRNPLTEVVFGDFS